MRTRSSGLTDDDDTNDIAGPNPRAAEDDATKETFTSANSGLNRPSETLDRRKSDKSLPSAHPTEAPWAQEPELYAHERREKGKETRDFAADKPAPDKSMELSSHGLSRRRGLWRCSWLTLITSLLSFVFLAAIYQSLNSSQIDPKGCRMSMMVPHYEKLTGFDTEHTRFASKYSLYLYRELGVDEDIRVKGVPVLFITGNAGSYKQVRSLAAEAARYYHDHVQQDGEAMAAGTRNLDFFTADFNEDITAFHGQTLLDQAEYLNEAVAYILSLYIDPDRSRRDPRFPDPSSVILVGHSMGGVVARTMLTMPNYRSNSVNTILTISTPHARPPIAFDADIVQTYQNINNYWREAYSQKWANNNPLWHVTLITIAGGGLDTTVPSDYTSVSSLVPDTHGFTVFTSTVPGVWTGTDHLSILWCDQLRKPIVKSLLEVVDVRRSSQTRPRADRMRIFKKWFLTGMEDVAEKTLPQKYPTTLLTLDDNLNSILTLGERLTIRHLGQSGKQKAFLLPVPAQGTLGGKRFTLLSDQPLDSPGANGKLEVLFCSVFPLSAGQSATLFSMNMDLSGTSSGSTRLACKNAASDTILLPASTATSKYSFDDTQPFSYLEYSLEDLTEHQFVAVVDKSKSPTSGWAIAEFSDNADSFFQSSIGLSRLLLSGFRQSLPAERPIVTEIRIPAISSSLLTYKLTVSPQACGDESEIFKPLLRQYISEPYESKYFVNVREANVNLHGSAPFMPPPLGGRSLVRGVALQIWSDPTCNSTLNISLKVDAFGSLGKLYMRYRTVFLAFQLIIVALVLRKQFMIHDTKGIFMSFAEALDLCLRGSLPVLLLAMTLLGYSMSSNVDTPTTSSPGFLHWAQNSTSTIDYSKNDLLLGSQDKFFWFLIPLFGFLNAGICVAVNYAALILIHVLSLIYSTLVKKPGWLSNGDRRRNPIPAFTATSPRRRIITTVFLLLMVSTIIPYQFAYMVACIVQIATCTRALRFAGETRLPAHYNFYNYAHSILILMLWVLPINIPVLVVWVHNLAVHWLTPFSSHHNVLSVMPFILLVETLTGGKLVPRLTTSFRHVTNFLLFFLAVHAAIYGVTYAYRLHHIANLVCAWLVALHFSTSGFSLSGLSHIFDNDENDGHIKKRP